MKSTLEVTKKIVELGISEAAASEMFITFVEQGGLACVLRWPEQFSMFCPSTNVLDIFLEYRVIPSSAVNKA